MSHALTDSASPSLRFTKMQGLGNDFVIFDGVRQRIELRPEAVRAIADRHFGVGCDQILLVEAATSPNADFRYRIFNADGTEVAQCGNGARCFAVFVRRAGLTNKEIITVETQSGHLMLHHQGNGEITVNMGIPQLAPADVPFRDNEEAPEYLLSVGDDTLRIAAVGMGNPHAVLRVSSVADAPVTTLGPRIETHPDFPRHCNVGFMEVCDRSHVQLRVWERGVGETLACGSNACAAIVAGIRWDELDHAVAVTLPGGSLYIEWAGPGQPVMMTGPAQVVFDGVWPISAVLGNSEGGS
ncbi:diaminopimelate epimerase [Acidithiobacillus ferriphilus]|uniref:diaminopimelate epimerase n=1 Tax=Acidithiobacillus ferriphilus TaxID=1689834 RepID=UPI001C0622FF|nr:diaminopimelate epimerase [Acidithiobacillus ferriphilus]MBU2784846.1 diaminopimelate epimerase [Acidithiobacillus ferriphilus]UEP59612.1 diaminopimelate epimerase [Acidithiobacillus ferriphilus]